MLRTARGRRAALGMASALAVLVACTSEPDGSAEPDTPTPATRTEPPPDSAPSVDPDMLLPDMTVLAATAVQIEARSGGRRLLRFGTRLANIGVGPIEVVPAPRASCPPGQRALAQEIAGDANGDGTYDRRVDTTRTRRAGACAVFHPTHDHWHIDGSARYQLRDMGGSTIVARRKVSFCMRDTDRVRGVRRGPRRVVYEGCTRDALQGISPGWSDLYDYDLDGQTLRLPPELPDGTYCLAMTADPFESLLESDETNNASVTPIVINGERARRTRSTDCADASP